MGTACGLLVVVVLYGLLLLWPGGVVFVAWCCFCLVLFLLPGVVVA